MTTPHSDAAPELSLQSSSIRGGGNIISPTISGHGRLFNVTVGTMNNPMLGDSFSAPLPVVSVRNCPLPTETFQGRQDILLDMQAYFEQKVHSQKIYLLYGLGGIGKTQIALKFVSDVGTKFTDTWFVNASSQQTIEADYKQIMINKNLANEPALQWLESSFENWLVLLDNANDISLNLHELLPNCRHGNVVITSRNPELQAHTLVTGLSKEIHQLDDPDAIKLLLVMSGIKDASGYQQDIALQIVQEVHCLPLAIAHAGAYILKSKLANNLPAYLELYHKEKHQLLENLPQQLNTGYHYAVYATWDLSFGKLSDIAVQLVQLCSLVRSTGIKELMFKNGCKYTRRGDILEPSDDELAPSRAFLDQFLSDELEWSTFTFHRVIDEIKGYSLMTFDDKRSSYSMHPLVQGWCQYKMANKEDLRLRMLMMCILGMAIKHTNKLTDKIELAAHTLTLLENVDVTEVTFPEIFAAVYRESGMYRDSQKLYLEVQCRLSALSSPDDPHMVQVHYRIAQNMSELGDHRGAEKLQAQVLRKWTEIMGPNHPDTLKAQLSLAAVKGQLGDHKGAEVLESQVLEKWTEILGPEHLNTLSTMSKLAVTKGKLGDHRGAVVLKSQVLKKRTEILGPYHPDTLSAMSNLAVTKGKLGDYRGAEVLESQVLEKLTGILGPDHPDTLSVMSNLAVTKGELGDHRGAEVLESQVLAKRTEILGPDHPDTFSVMSNLAVTKGKLGDHKGAEVLKSQVLEKRTELLGPDHPNTLSAMANLAVTKGELGDHRGAEVLELQVLEKRTEILGPDHPNTLNTMSNLAETKGNLGDYRAAEQLMTQVLHKYTDLFGEDHPKTVGAKELLDSLATVEESNERSASPEEHGCLPACCAIC